MQVPGEQRDEAVCRRRAGEHGVVEPFRRERA